MLIDTDQLNGPTAQAVTESGSGALMLVLGSRGTGAFTALLLGSVSRYAASHASTPVMVIRDDPPAPHGLVGVGGGSSMDTAKSIGVVSEHGGSIASYEWGHDPIERRIPPLVAVPTTAGRS